MVSLHAALAVLALSGTGQTVLIDFYADWCGPCRAMDATVRDLAAKGYPVRRVNIDHDRALAMQYRVQSIPCFVMLVDGREVDRTVGGTSLARLEKMCQLGHKAGMSGGGSMLASAPRPLPLARGGATIRPALTALTPATTIFPTAGPASNAAIRPATLGAAPPAQFIPVSQPPAVEQGGASDDFLLAVSARLRIEDSDGHSCGSGTLVDSRPGEALILTCGHVFRDSQGKGKIEVDLFGPHSGSRLPGRLIGYDLQRDVGLVAVQTRGPVPVARIAPAGYVVRAGDPVASVGCNNGDAPTVQHSRINSLDRFLGPPNYQVAGQPVVGRSGGGLFSADGQVIGVCNAADPSDKEGLFAALGTIHAQLDQMGLAQVYQAQPRTGTPSEALAATAAVATEPSTPRIRLPGTTVDPLVRPASAEAAEAPLSANEQAAMDDLRRRVKEGAEVLCIVRDPRDPQAKSQVFMLDRASPSFVRQLSAAAQPAAAPHETSLEVPQSRQPILEWDLEGGWRHREALPPAGR